MAALFEAENLRYGYVWGKQYHEVLHGVTVAFPESCFSALVGPSGMGKTTLLNLLGLLDRPREGSLKMLGRSVERLAEREAEAIRLKDLGFVFQAFHLIPTLTVLENTAYFLPQLGLSGPEAEERAVKTLEQVGLEDQRSKFPLELSGGQRQRVAIARALAKRPKVILADEPSASLDRATAEEILGLFQKLHRDLGTSFLFSTHDMHLVSACDKVYELRDGRVQS